MNVASFLRIHKRAESRILRAFSIPSGREAYDGKRIVIDRMAIMNALEAVFLLSKALSIYDLKRRERKRKIKQYSEDDLLGEILKALDFREYENTAKRTVREIREDPGSYLKPSPFVDEFLKEYAFALARPFEQHSREIEEAVRRGMYEGKAYLDIAEDLEKVMGGYLNRADVIATTESTRAFSLGILDAGIESPVVDGFQLIAVMDNRTTSICSERDRLVIPKDDPDLLAENTPPLHPRCRSMLVPHTIYDPKGKPLSREEMERMHSRYPEAIPINRQVDRDVVKALISSRNITPAFPVNEGI
jgi:SPP1 gp7 family putative phage head morphogenesis protein